MKEAEAITVKNEKQPSFLRMTAVSNYSGKT
jgi:hypothetical protein